MKTDKELKRLMMFNAIGQTTVIALCILIMLLHLDYRFHPIVVLGYATTTLIGALQKL